MSNCGSITYSSLYTGSLTTPLFIVFNSTNRSYSIQTYANSDKGNYTFTITGTVASRFHTFTKTVNFQVEVKPLIIPFNSGPPFFPNGFVGFISIEAGTT